MALGLLGWSATSSAAEPPEAEIILFLGDSITYQGTYVTVIEAALITQYPDRNYRIINLGLGSETVSGLSEEGHAGGRFLRPDLHERLDRALKQAQPDLVIACYGMNDGIYLPLADDRFAAYQKGITRRIIPTCASLAILGKHSGWRPLLKFVLEELFRICDMFDWIVCVCGNGI